MANTGKTQYLGTVVEVRAKGSTVWEKFVCNTGAITIDFGTYDVSETDPCLETGATEKVFGAKKYDDQTFDYAWTQALTSAADGIMKTAFDSKGTSEVEFRLTMDNTTGTEVTGTTYVIPFKVNGYKHLGESGGVWKTEAAVVQSGDPVETAAA